MIKSKLFKIFSLITFISFNVVAQEQHDYERVNAGEVVQYNGFLFSDDGMARLYVNIEERIRLAQEEGKKQVKVCKIDIAACEKAKEVELRIQKQMYEEQLRVKQSTIDSYKSQAFWNNMQGIGGIILGVGAAFLIFKLTNP